LLCCNYNALVIGFGPPEHASTIAPMPEAVTRELDRVFPGE
jgi:hypothetical protein